MKGLLLKEWYTQGRVLLVTLIALAAVLLLCGALIGCSKKGQIMDGDGMLNTYRQISQAEAREIMERENLGDTIVLVTNSWHEFRASMIASDIDLPCGNEGAATPPWRLPSNYLRELFGIAYQFVF